MLDRYEVRALFHITHRENIAGIAKDGILSHRRAHGASAPVDISYADVQDIRRGKRDPLHGRLLHDYAALYFRAHNPMLSARRSRRDKLVVVHLNAEVLLMQGVIFTDGNAASVRTSFFEDAADLSRLDWECLKATYWTGFEDGKRKRCAEILVSDRVSPRSIQRATVHNEQTRQYMSQAGWRWPIQVRPKWFF